MRMKGMKKDVSSVRCVLQIFLLLLWYFADNSAKYELYNTYVR